ncbi:acyl-CoA dehydrogenase family protein [Vitreimonas flagellata]|uniref:acyl-CoA dehydrogenase family protein n=1 Tax=Vitreimonas flagellata TaxID=2560861 RepID=UPI001074E5AA|nr:acyl-CoA dehydrogenase family protein [Vitreimonas flagellata]
MTDVQLEQFRKDTRAWLEENCPASMRSTFTSEDEIVWGGKKAKFANPDSKLWLDRMAERGWTAPTWPKEYGGGGLSKEENLILQSELKRINARQPLYSFGLWMLGPVLLEYANEDQKKRHLPPVIRGEIRWCQGYSEPGAGSDLAGLQTKCEDKGDHWLINGQKIWTSYANYADWCFCLVRTDTSVKHEGISFILIDMTSPGVETRPIKLISGASPFCETFFTDVKVPKENMVGRLNGGWEIAKRLLQYERSNISGFGSGARTDVVDIAKQNVGLDEDGRLDDRDLRARIAEHKMFERAYALTAQRAAEEAKAGGNVSHITSMFKVAGATLNIERCELMVEAAGSRAFGWAGEGYSPDELAVTRGWLRSKGNSIEGGTTEVNLNVVAKRVLGLRDTQ